MEKSRESEEKRKCPKCGHDMVVGMKVNAAGAEMGKDWACTNFPACGLIEPYEESERRMREMLTKDLNGEG